MRVQRRSRLFALVAFALVQICYPAPATAGRQDAQEAYRDFFEIDRSDARSLWERALDAIGFDRIDVGRSYALIAGVDWYPNMNLGAGESLPPARADIEMLKKYLTEQEHIDELIVLTNESFTIENLNYFLHSYFPEQLSKHRKSRLLFAFSGHGVNEGGVGHLLTQQASSTRDVAEGISLTVLRGLFNRTVSRAHHLLVLINACEPGGFIQTSFGDENLLPAHPGAHAIMAGGSDEATWADTRPSRRGSLFFETVIDGLNGGADTFPRSNEPGVSSGDGIITTDELQTYLKLTIRKMTGQIQNPDGGNIRPGGSNGSFFFLNRHRQLEKGIAEPWNHENAYKFGGADMGLAQEADSAEPADTQIAIGVYEREAGEVFRDCEECPEMVVVPSGDFLMGSPEDEEGRDDDEGPRHRVHLKAFALARTEVTFEQWEACVSDGGCRTNAKPDDEGWGRGERPVINVSWRDAQTFIDWLNGKVEGNPYRLPSEAEWEYAARAGTQTPFAFGETISTAQANYDGNAVYRDGKKGEYRGRTLEVGALSAENSWKLRHMHGNVWEWVEDCWHDDYRGAPDDGSAWRDEHGGDCSRRVLRGGSWNEYPRILRAANRLANEPEKRITGLGFRPAKTLLKP